MKPAKLDFILLIPCYNNLDGLIKSVNSVNYPPDKYEILVVDDGSLLPIVKEELGVIDPAIKIQIIRIFPNQGILNALNTGLKELRERNDLKYIARLDAGDTCSAERFTKQVRFLDAHDEISLLGTWCRFEDQKTRKGYDYISKTKHEEIVKEMHFKCSFIHPTVMFKKELLDKIGFYPEGFPYAEDYAYFWYILKKFKGEILPEVLVNIEYLNTNVSAKNYKMQLVSRMKIVKKFGTHFRSRSLGLFLLMCRFLIPKKMIENYKLIR